MLSHLPAMFKSQNWLPITLLQGDAVHLGGGALWVTWTKQTQGSIQHSQPWGKDIKPSTTE